MSKYLTTLRLGFMDAIEYRTEFFISVLGWGIRLFIAVFLWQAVAAGRGGMVGGYTFPKIMGYFFLVQIISSFVFARVGFDIAKDIQRGDFANFMLKPINYILFRMIYEVSKNAFRLLIAITIFGTALFVFFGGFSAGISAGHLGLAIMAIGGGYAINFFLTCLIALSSFWIINSLRLMFIYFGILTIFSGMILPLNLFPPNLGAIISLLPFPYIFYFPAALLQNSISSPEIIKSFTIEAAYVSALGLLVYLMYKRGVKRFESVGR